jgi:hypothetical protein
MNEKKPEVMTKAQARGEIVHREVERSLVETQTPAQIRWCPICEARNVVDDVCVICDWGCAYEVEESQ